MSEIAKVLPYCVDLDKPLEKTQLHTLFLMGDQNAHRIELEITRSGQTESLDGCTVAAYFVCLSSDVTIKLEGTTKDGKAVVVLSKQCYTHHGQFALVVQIESGDVTASVFHGEGFMRRSTTETIVYDDYIIYDVSTLLSQITSMKTATHEANAAAEAANAVIDATNAAKDAANTAAENAGAAAGTANAASRKVDGMTIDAVALDTAQPPTASVETVYGHLAIHLGLPRGLTGATPQITFDVATGEPGTDATATVSGTAEAPHLLLTIPRGDTGSIGNLKINGKAPGADSSVTLAAQDVGARPESWTPGIGDIEGLQAAIDNAGGVKTVAGASPDSAGDIALTAQDVGALSIVLLWENASMTTAIDTATYPMDLSGYDAVLVETKASTTVERVSAAEIPVGGATNTNYVSGYNSTFYSRLVTVATDGVTLDTGYKSGTKDTTACIPWRIWGIKGRRRTA